MCRRLVYPEYYPRFQCVADRCTHTCCIGWEIDIDDEALARYDRANGPLGDRLRAGILRGQGEARFALDENERCPMLNANGLCDLIVEMGEEALCQICADHPRFRAQLSGREEIGLGLCCEAACRLILNWSGPVRLVSREDGKKERLDARERAFLKWREALFSIAQDRSRPVDERMNLILERSGINLREDWAFWRRVYLSLERMDDAWANVLEGMAETRSKGCVLNEIAREQLLVYFLYRHLIAGFETGDMPGCAAFAVLSVRAICRLAREEQQLPDIARMYSAEIEYSDENVLKLIDAIYESEETA